MSKKYLLTGAGFSKSFGALLCNELTAEFFNSLIQEKEIQKNLLNKWGNFEQSLSEIRQNYPEKILDFEKNLKCIFQKMHCGMRINHTNHGQSSFTDDSIHNFFWMFDCVFTLNQDSFSRKCGSNNPQMSFLDQRNTQKISLKTHNLPYLELHGAYDWEEVFILGSSKEEEIEKHDQIKKFHQFFEECLSKENSKLVIIGYSFCDSHINEMIRQGIKNDLEIFIWDPGVNNLLAGLKSNFSAESMIYTSNDCYKGIDANDLKKSLRGYLPKNFSLIGKDKESVYKFLNS